VLNFNGTARGIDGTCELNQNAVASPLDDATAMFRDFGIHKLTPMSIKPR
jgi:hypothetical protein